MILPSFDSPSPGVTAWRGNRTDPDVPLFFGAAPGTASPPEHSSGIEQLEARQVHTLEVVCSSPTPTILLYTFLLFCLYRMIEAFLVQ